MADALCGPSNALQSFQKHTSVDRTLQQDHLTSRQSPTEGFRSSLGPNAGILDPEFDAFQAGHAPPPQPTFQQLHPSLAQSPFAPHHAQAAAAAPDWASDFQRMNIGPSHSALVQQQQQQARVSNVAASWHQDFLNQSSAIQSPVYAGRSPGGMGAFGRPIYQGFGTMNNIGQEAGNGKQRAEAELPGFDDAAFERAFAQVQRDIESEMELKGVDTQEEQDVMQAKGAERVSLSSMQQDYKLSLRLLEEQNHLRLEAARREMESSTHATEDTPDLLRLLMQRPSVYMTIKTRAEVDLGREAQALPYLECLEMLERSGKLTADASEAKWCVDALQKLIDRDVPQVVLSRVETLIKAINERLMSTYPLLTTGVRIRQDDIWEELRSAGYTTEGVQENLFPGRETQQPTQEQKKEQQSLRNDDDEMAETAGQLLERVADNTSEKFQKSQFLELMRRLRDREVRVEGDKMVEVSAQSSVPSLQSAATSAPPDIDPNILDHAVLDFGMPVDSEQELEHTLSRTSTGPTTDEISGQFQHYNVNSTYHR